MSCDICYKDTDESMCLSCQDDAWKAALGHGRREGINQAIAKLREKGWMAAAELIAKSFL